MLFLTSLTFYSRSELNCDPYSLFDSLILLTINSFSIQLKQLVTKVSSVMKSRFSSSSGFNLIHLIIFSVDRQSTNHLININNLPIKYYLYNFHQLTAMISFVFPFLGLIIIGHSVITTYGHPCGAEAAEDTIDAFLEQPLFSTVKVWHLVMILMLIGIIATIVACCIMRCRIPRTKQEIEADAIRKKVTKQFRAHLNKIPIEGMELIGVLNEVKDYEEERIQKGTIEEKKTLMKRLKALFSSDKQDSMERSVSKDEGDIEDNKDDQGEEMNEKSASTNPKLINTIVSITSDVDQITVSSPTLSSKEKY
ncbi:uncharacterized protein LOC128396989 [Panonychus citri]|uniref:uncharacterized protein LOC128396989 n=1 Tax=Panonychus citri TaxID=50023 RepID=UPI0023074B48|nr:uncharacterized protein LOC128396989 [Panonychus citri]